MAGLNKVMLIGRLGKDPELRHTHNNTAICKFSLATSEQIPSANGERQERTAWHNITIFGKQAEVANRYLKKGQEVYLEGRLEYGSYDDRQGVKRYTTDIIVNKFVFIGGRSSGSMGPSGGSTQEPAPASYGSNASSGQPAGQSYGSSSSQNYDFVPEGDNFSDDDIPF